MYKAVLFSPDGDWVTDFLEQSISKVEENLENVGSKWHFYPIHFVIEHNGSNSTSSDTKIVASPDVHHYPYVGFTIGEVAHILSEEFLALSADI